MGVTVLFVCTGNVCRSPMAELLSRSQLRPGSPLHVSSAGTGALVGEGMDLSSASALRRLGLDPTPHRARQFQAWMAYDADLILTAERAHRDIVMTALPGSLRRTFTMKEFARLSRYLPSAGPGTDPRAVIARVAGLRHVDGPIPETDENITDPYCGPVSLATEIAREVAATVHATLEVLGLRTRDTAVARPPVARPRPQPRSAAHPSPGVRRPRPDPAGRA